MSGLFQWTLPSTPLRSSDPAAIAAMNSSKLGAVGGSSGGLLGSAAEVGIALLDVTGLGTAYCGGAIGRGGNKMCVATGCLVSSHATVKVMLDTKEHPTDTEFVFIQSTTKKPMDQAAVFVKPFVPASRLGSKLERYLADTRTVNSWETLFLHLGSAFQSEQEDFEVAQMFARCESELPTGMTPMKKRSRLTVASPALEAGFEATLMPLEPDLGPSSLFETNVRTGWKPLVANFDTLATLVMGAKELVQKLSAGTKLELEGVDYLIARLRAELGTRPEDWGTESAFEKLGHAVMEIDELFSRLKTANERHARELLAAKAETASAIQTATDNIQQAMIAELQPIFHLFSITSSCKTAPGDKYLAELNFVKAELQAVKQLAQAAPQTGSSASAPGARAVTWGMGTMNLAPVAPLPSPAGTSGVAAPAMSTMLAGRLKNLEDSVSSIEAQLIAESVELGGVSFPSRSATKAWLKIKAAADIVYVFFLDPHSFMNVGYSGAGDSVAQLGLQAASAKAGFSSSEEALVVSSYKFELPTFFGKETKDSRKLPVCPTAKAWDSRDGFTGVRYEFRKLIHST
jgi:hypothetical protein